MIPTVQAIAADLVAGQETSRQSPPRYVALNGAKYWLKANAEAAGAHNCLTAELAAGALGASIGASPEVAVVELSSTAAKPEHQAMAGSCFGSLDVPTSLNVRQFQSRGLRLPIERLNAEHAALVWAFQTWIGQGDWQCLVDAGDGRVYSIDHESWAAFEQSAAPVGDVADHGGLLDLGRSPDAVGAATAAIEAVTDAEIHAVMTAVPTTGRFAVPAGHLEAVAQSLIRRRAELRASMVRWQK